MGKAGRLRPLVERADRVGRQRAEAHGGDVEHRGVVRLETVGAADANPEIVILEMGRREGMRDPFVARLVDIVFGAEGALVELALGALVGERALVARERAAVLLALEEVLPDLRPQLFHDVAGMTRDRIVPEHRALGLHDVVDAHRHQEGHDEERHDQPGIEPVRHQDHAAEQHEQDDRSGQRKDPRRKIMAHPVHEGPPRDSYPESSPSWR
jgi:hypothetical protein